MNNILEEITYCDGKMGDVAKVLYTPAKLKLRARTYDGINENLSKRRGPVMESATFSIPSAFMAVEVPSGDEEGNGYSVIQPEDLESATIEDQKKLKINNSQLEGIMAHAPFNQEVEETEVSEDVQEEVYESDDAVNEVEISEPTTEDEEVKEEIEEQPVIEEEEVSNYEEPVIEQPTVDPLDAAREKVLNSQIAPEVTNEDKQPDAVEEAEERDVFKDLERITGEYAQVDEEFKKSAQALEEAQKTLEESKNSFGKIEENIERTTAKIQERNESIDSAIKEKEEIEAQIREIEEKTKLKIRLVADAKDKRLREKYAKEEETSKVLNENQDYQDKIRQRSEEASQLEQRDRELLQQENDALDAKREAQDRYNSKLAVFEAITLPDGIDLDMEEVAAIGEFPVMEEEKGKSYKKVA